MRPTAILKDDGELTKGPEEVGTNILVKFFMFRASMMLKICLFWS